MQQHPLPKESTPSRAALRAQPSAPHLLKRAVAAKYLPYVVLRHIAGEVAHYQAGRAAGASAALASLSGRQCQTRGVRRQGR